MDAVSSEKMHIRETQGNRTNRLFGRFPSRSKGANLRLSPDDLRFAALRDDCLRYVTKESHRFGAQWLNRLDTAGIESLHMKDAMRLGGKFRG